MTDTWKWQRVVVRAWHQSRIFGCHYFVVAITDTFTSKLVMVEHSGFVVGISTLCVIVLNI